MRVASDKSGVGLLACPHAGTRQYLASKDDRTGSRRTSSSHFGQTPHHIRGTAWSESNPQTAGDFTEQRKYVRLAHVQASRLEPQFSRCDTPRGDYQAVALDDSINVSNTLCMISSSAVVTGFIVLVSNCAFAQANAGGKRPLIPPILRPVLQYSTYFGGSAIDSVSAVVIGADGYVYVAGTTRSEDFPITPGAYQTRYGGNGSDTTGGGDAFVSKIDPKNMTLVYSTYVGGSLDETVTGLAVDATGNVYIIGTTSSTDFPRTPGAYGRPGGANFVTKLNPFGTALIYSATFGSPTTTAPDPVTGSMITTWGDYAACLAVDAQGSVYIAGWTGSSTFPATPGVVQPALNPIGTDGIGEPLDAFVMKLNVTGTNLVFATYLGGAGWDRALSIAVGYEGDVWLAGNAGSSFPVTPDAMVASIGPYDPNTFIARLNSNATALLYSSYIPGVYDPTLTLDASGSAYIAGEAASRSVVLTPPFETLFDGINGSYYAKLTPGGQAFVYSAVLPGGGGLITSVTADSSGKLYLAGSAGMPQPILDGGLPSCNRDTLLNEYGVPQGGAFLAVVDSAGQLLTSSYLGGCLQNSIASIAPGPDGTLYVAGATSSFDFPVTASAIKSGNNTPQTGFVSTVVLTKIRYPRIGRICDAASFDWGALVPGQLIVIDGADLGPERAAAGQFVNGVLQNSVAGTRVLFDGIPAPLFSVSPDRIYAVVPFSATGVEFGWPNWRRTFIEVVRDGVASARWGEYMDSRLPAFFTADGSGQGQASAVNADGTMNSPANPAARGSTITLYLSGAGAMDSPVADGQMMTTALTLSPIYDYICIGHAGTTENNCTGKIQFIGAVPGHVAGLTQLQYQIPSADSFSPPPVGERVPVTLFMDDQTTQPNVFIAIK